MNDTVETTIAPAAENDGWEWAIVEIMGHRKHAGRIREEERFGAKMLRVDVPTPTPEPTLFDAAEGKKAPPAIIVPGRIANLPTGNPGRLCMP